jgi:hypothetical protein
MSLYDSRHGTTQQGQKDNSEYLPVLSTLFLGVIKYPGIGSSRKNKRRGTWIAANSAAA